MSRCAGAGREHSQTDSPSWPMEIFHMIDVVLSLWRGVSWGARIRSSPLLAAVSSNPLLSRSPFFSRSSVFFGNFVKFAISGFCDRFSGTGCELVIGWWEKCIVHSLFCISVIITVTSSVSISLVILLNCLYLNPQAFPFIHLSSPSCGGWGREGVSEWLSGP